MEKRTREDVMELIEMLEEHGWEVGNFDADELTTKLRGSDGRLDTNVNEVVVSLKASKDYHGK